MLYYCYRPLHHWSFAAAVVVAIPVATFETPFVTFESTFDVVPPVAATPFVIVATPPRRLLILWRRLNS